ncbi:hypothetical protein ACVIU7_007943 [Bradyrhizobium liaoningense]|uniref:Swt1 family HEPN domain-containing protein n=1 Tax=Bradyrhizobium liaoningense TaxID=43992 RepID=UPI00235CCB2F|nr:Swt1 family HEPN domain-containing protein [Bradyrhizobium liaoningense]GLR97619.1 hypothetical protein GCM10007858_52610 [Bradyrhizobium liaoningense]
MTNDPTKSLSIALDAFRREDETLKALRRAIEPSAIALKAFQVDSGFLRMMEDFRRQGEAMRAALGPFEDLRRSGMFDQLSAFSESTRQAVQAIGNYRAHFELPAISQAAQLFKQFQESGIAKEMRLVHEQSRAIQSAMESMRSPWLDIQNQLKSMGSFAELQSIGISLRSFNAYDESLVSKLRINLGDWRETIKWPDTIFTDAVARTEFYADMGLNTGLTDFPADAFQQGALLAGLTINRAALVPEYDGTNEANEEEAGFERTNAAHDLLLRFETNIRRFIDQQMTAAFGNGWIKQRVPGEIQKDWHDKRERARERGEQVWPLIAYADFAHYLPIIVRRDNWEAVFAAVFRRRESVTESFQRLYPLRIATMHARLITQDDELYLYVEAKRLLSAIGITI